MNRLFAWKQTGVFLLALAAGILPFAVPEVCAAALREGLTLCSGPLLLSLFPFLVVSRLLIQCPESDLLALPFRLAAWGIGIRTPCAARVLCIGFLGGFAPAASAAAQAVRTGQLTAEEADALLPACICSGPSFVVLTVGQSLLGSAELGVLLFASQITANYLTAALLNRFAGVRSVKPRSAAPASPAPPRLDEILADAAITYCKLCGFILFFRMLAAGAGALLPAGAGTLCAVLLEVCSGCDLASRTGRWGSLLCCAALSVQGSFRVAAGAHHLPAGNDPAPALPVQVAPSAAFTGPVLSAAAGRGDGCVQYPACPGPFDAAGAAGLCPARFCSVLYGSLHFAQWNPSS